MREGGARLCRCVHVLPQRHADVDVAPAASADVLRANGSARPVSEKGRAHCTHHNSIGGIDETLETHTHAYAPSTLLVQRRVRWPRMVDVQATKKVMQNTASGQDTFVSAKKRGLGKMQPSGMLLRDRAQQRQSLAQMPA
eukprot:6202895-Pleurochrysis_carterae.AAC.4